MPLIKTPQYWKKLAEDISVIKGVVMVLGASDVGKTTLVFYLAGELLRRGNRVSVVSADMGQCAFGPPATISMGMPESTKKSLECIPVHSMYFVGSTSPVGHFLQTIVGVKKLVERSLREGAEVVIVDTTGLVSGGAAWELKHHKIELAGARCIVALQRERELEDIVLPFERRAGVKLYRLPVSGHVRSRSYAERREYRRQRYGEYFRGSKCKSLSLTRIHIISPYDRAVQAGEADAFKRILVGLNDENNFTAALGIVEKMDIRRGVVRLVTPLKDLLDVRSIRLGSVRIEEDGNDSKVGSV
ncbi:MAG: Clp1/GlmU family protein [Candidatus Brocadiales bacterium]